MYPTYPSDISGCVGNCGAYGDGPSFCLVNKEGNGLVYSPGCCKEYILDYTYYTFSNHNKSPYATTPLVPASLDEVRLLVGNWKKHIPDSLDLLNQIETALEIPHSIPFEVPNNREAFVFRGSPRWLIAPPMFSLYGLIIRAGRRHTAGKSYKDTLKTLPVYEASPDKPYPPVDTTIWQGAMPAVAAILKYGDRAVFGQDSKRNWIRNNGSGVHGWGIQGLGSSYLKSSFPDFYYLLPETQK